MAFKGKDNVVVGDPFGKRDMTMETQSEKDLSDGYTYFNHASGSSTGIAVNTTYFGSTDFGDRDSGNSIAIGNGVIVYSNPTYNSNQGIVGILGVSHYRAWDGYTQFQNTNTGGGGKTYVNRNKHMFGPGGSSSASSFWGNCVRVNAGRIYVGAPGYSSGRGGIWSYDLNGSTSAENEILSGFLGTYSTSCGLGRIFDVGCGVIAYNRDDSTAKMEIRNLNNLSGAPNVYNGVKQIVRSDFTSGTWPMKIEIGHGRIVTSGYTSSTAGKVCIYGIHGEHVRDIQAPTPTNGDNFGRYIGVGGGHIIVGAPDNNNSSGKGKAYIYTLDGDLVRTLTPGTTYGSVGEYYGSSVGLDSQFWHFTNAPDYTSNGIPNIRSYGGSIFTEYDGNTGGGYNLVNNGGGPGVGSNQAYSGKHLKSKYGIKVYKEYDTFFTFPARIEISHRDKNFDDYFMEQLEYKSLWQNPW